MNSLSWAATVVVLIGALGVVIWLWRGSQIKGKQARKVAQTSKEQAEIAAKAPRTRKGRIDKLKKKGL